MNPRQDARQIQRCYLCASEPIEHDQQCEYAESHLYRAA